MLCVLIIWISHFIVFKTFGHIAARILKIKGISWLNELLIGYCFTNILSLIFSNFFATNAFVHLVLFVFSIIYIIFNKIKIIRMENHEPINLLLMALIGFSVLLLTLPEPNHGDSSFYHAQALQWVEQYGAVPGLANFFGRLGFNSSFFNVQALFSFYPFTTFPSRFLNSFLVLIWILFLFQNLVNKNLKDKERFFNFFFLIITFCISRGWVSSIAPDVAVGIFMLAICFYVLRQLLFNTFVSPNFLLILFATAVTIKLSAVLLLPIVLWFIYLNKKLNKTLFVIPALIGIVWLIRNVIISGYLVYPYLSLGALKPQWAVPYELAVIERNWISSWAKIPSENWQYVLSLSVWEWFPKWFVLQSLFNKILTLCYGVASLCLLFIVFKNKMQKKSFSIVFKLLLVWATIIGIWLVLAPDYRFAYGFVLPFMVACIFIILKNNFNFMKIISIGKYVYLLLLVCFTYYIIQKQRTPLTHLIILPQAYKKVNTSNYKINETNIRVAPIENNCNNTCIPCVNEDLLNTNIQMRGKTIEEGFKQ